MNYEVFVCKIKQRRKRGVTINNRTAIMNKTVTNCSGAFINKPQTGKNAKARRISIVRCTPFYASVSVFPSQCYSWVLNRCCIERAKLVRERSDKVGNNLFMVLQVREKHKNLRMGNVTRKVPKTTKTYICVHPTAICF